MALFLPLSQEEGEEQQGQEQEEPHPNLSGKNVLNVGTLYKEPQNNYSTLSLNAIFNPEDQTLAPFIFELFSVLCACCAK